MKADIRVQLIDGLAYVSVKDLVLLLRAAGGVVVKGELPGMKRKREATR